MKQKKFNHQNCLSSKKMFLLIVLFLMGIPTAFSQSKIQFIEGQIGQSVMLQRFGYSLFDNAVGDNIALTESLHLGWGKDESKSTGIFLQTSLIPIPFYNEDATTLTLDFETRRYYAITPTLRCHSGLALGGVYASNRYDIENNEFNDSRYGISMMLFSGVELTKGEHLYCGLSIYLSADIMLHSSFQPFPTTPNEGSNCIIGNRILFSAGYRL